MRRFCDENKDTTLREQALAQYRATRDKLESDHPGLMQDLRDQLQTAGGDSEVPIARRKNLEAVMLFLEASSSPALRRQLGELLSR